MVNVVVGGWEGRSRLVPSVGGNPAQPDVFNASRFRISRWTAAKGPVAVPRSNGTQISFDCVARLNISGVRVRAIKRNALYMVNG